jgi:hypothetical protein
VIGRIFVFLCDFSKEEEDEEEESQVKKNLK